MCFRVKKENDDDEEEEDEKEKEDAMFMMGNFHLPSAGLSLFEAAVLSLTVKENVFWLNDV